MKIKLLVLVMVALSTVQAEWAKSITYSLKVSDKCQWGIGGVSGIVNNNGKAGVIEGDSSDFLLCASMPYGVKTWKETIPKEYMCHKSAVDAVHKEQADDLKNATNCKLAKDNSGKLIDLSLFYEGVESFVKGIDDAAELLVAAFPDLSKGEGYTSEGYVQLCKAPANKNVLEQLVAVTNKISKTLNLAACFPNNQFIFSLDYSEYIPSEEEKESITTQITIGNLPW